MPSIFPLEIEEMILNLLAEDSDDEDDELEGHSTLKTCSLVCQAFLPICRKHIFGIIILKSSNIHAFQRLLRETPEIAGLIRELDCNIIKMGLTTISPSIQESLKRISRLESLTLQRHYKDNFKAYKLLDWSNNPIRPALLHLLHLPTLIYFNVGGFCNFVPSDLIPCVNLKYLDIVNLMSFTSAAAENTFPATFPKHSIQLNELVTPGDTAIELCIARRPSGCPIIDLGSLSKLTVHIYGDAPMELFRRCHFLTNVNISFFNPQNVRPSLADMLRPSMQTLRHIVLDICFNDKDVDPLFGISSELEVMRTKNIIESVTIMVRTDADFRRGDDWGRLDEVLTAPGWVSLKQVSLAIDINSNDNELGVVLGKLPETHFSRLSSSNSVSFDFKVEILSEGIIL